MCAINGYLQFKNILDKEEIRARISGMNDSVYHRGPDEEGIYVDNNIGLGARRLKIIDLKSGSQPVFNEDRSLVIVLNGEIYNYKTLRKKLVDKGHKFYTASDTEVFLHAFEEYKYDCFNKLKGMFAAAIYDMKTEKIILARDRAGEKPLHYYLDGRKLIFASELKSLFTTGLIGKEIDRSSLCQYLQLTYIPAPKTIFQGVKKLYPGHYMEIDFSGNVVCNQYWDVQYSSSNLIAGYDDCKKQLRSTLFNAVEENMEADVPVGAFLSGGIDSSIIVGIMSKISTKPVETFTVRHYDRQYDDGARARAIASLNKTSYHEHCLDYNEIVGELETILNALDEPFADSSVISAHMISKYASRYVKTVLTGDGGDELFAGYNKHLITHYAKMYGKIPKSVRDKIIKRMVCALPDSLNTRSIVRKAKKVILSLEEDTFTVRKNLMCLGFKLFELNRLLQPEYLVPGTTDFIEEYYIRYNKTADELSQALYTDFKVVLEGDMFPKVDRMSMLNSIETRTPLIYPDVVELAARIPNRFKIREGRTKIIFKDAFSDFLPYKILHGKKRGFGVPVGRWLQNELKKDLLDYLNEEFIRQQGIFNYPYIKKIAQQHFSGSHNRFSELWSLFVFQHWYLRNLRP